MHRPALQLKLDWEVPDFFTAEDIFLDSREIKKKKKLNKEGRHRPTLTLFSIYYDVIFIFISGFLCRYFIGSFGFHYGE